MKLITDNRKARFNYFIDSTVEAGLMLVGSEVKSLRNGHVNLGEAYAIEDKGELWLVNAHISPLTAANRFNHEPLRRRKVLLRKHEMNKLIGLIERSGYTLVPLKLYFNDRGIAKLELALARGKKAPDKRDTIKTRDWNREKGRLLREKG